MHEDLKIRMDSTLRLACRASGPQKEYRRYVRQFLDFVGEKPETSLCEADVRT